MSVVNISCGKTRTTLADNTDLTQFKKNFFFFFLNVSKILLNLIKLPQKKIQGKTTVNLQNYLCLSKYFCKLQLTHHCMRPVRDKI